MTRNLSWRAASLMLVVSSVVGNQCMPPAVAQRQAPARAMVRKVAPEYPEIAKRMNLTGKVKLRIVIAPDGNVKTVQVLGGHPILVQAATEAVKSWKFTPQNAESEQLLEVEFAGTEVR